MCQTYSVPIPERPWPISLSQIILTLAGEGAVEVGWGWGRSREEDSTEGAGHTSNLGDTTFDRASPNLFPIREQRSQEDPSLL